MDRDLIAATFKFLDFIKIGYKYLKEVSKIIKYIINNLININFRLISVFQGFKAFIESLDNYDNQKRQAKKTIYLNNWVINLPIFRKNFRCFED